MAHNCIDWSVTPPVRKIPLLVLTRGDDHVYTIIPNDFKTLEQVARKEFGLGEDVDITFSSACANLCNGRPARITEAAWEQISTFIGCVTVNVADSVNGLPPPENLKRKLPLDADEEENESERERPDQVDLSTLPNGSAKTVVQDEPPPRAEENPDVPSDHGNDLGGASTTAGDEREETSGEELSAIPQRRSRIRRRLLSQNMDDNADSETSEKEPQATASQVPPIASSPKPSQQEVKKERYSYSLSQTDLGRAEPFDESSKLIKQEKSEAENQDGSSSHDTSLQSTHTKPPPELGTQAQTESSGDYHKLMIRVAHRPSQQESKFTTKSTTRVAKVLAAVCKSFGLDAGRATLYLIVSTHDENGEEENLFPCDKNDTIARAGAEQDVESKFLLKVAGET